MNAVKSADDYKMRWKCMDKGCYLDKVEPRLWDFHDCFPKNMSMGDIDGIVEINSRTLLSRRMERRRRYANNRSAHPIEKPHET